MDFWYALQQPAGQLRSGLWGRDTLLVRNPLYLWDYEPFSSQQTVLRVLVLGTPKEIYANNYAGVVKTAEPMLLTDLHAFEDDYRSFGAGQQVIESQSRQRVILCENAVGMTDTFSHFLCYDKSVVHASGHSTVEAFQNSTVLAHDVSLVFAQDSTVVSLWDNARVSMFGNQVKLTSIDQSPETVNRTGQGFTMDSWSRYLQSRNADFSNSALFEDFESFTGNFQSSVDSKVSICDDILPEEVDATMEAMFKSFGQVVSRKKHDAHN